MRKKLLTLGSVLALTLALGGAAQGSSNQRSGWELKAELTGDQEVPPVTTETTGRAKFKVRGDTLMFRMQLRNAEDVFGAAGAHIHCAPAGVNGPVVAFLAGAVPGGLDGRVRVEGVLTDANIVNDACGADIAALVESMRDGDAYVNVHSSVYPAGVVRGQIYD